MIPANIRFQPISKGSTKAVENDLVVVGQNHGICRGHNPVNPTTSPETERATNCNDMRMTESRWFCFDDVDEYKIVVSQEHDFEEAKGLCVSENATLGRISSDSELAAAVLLGQELDAPEIWIGVELDADPGSGIAKNDHGSYRYVDGFSNEEFFQVRRGRFPWIDFEPSNGGDKNCVAMTPQLR